MLDAGPGAVMPLQPRAAARRDRARQRLFFTTAKVHGRVGGAAPSARERRRSSTRLPRACLASRACRHQLMLGSGGPCCWKSLLLPSALQHGRRARLGRAARCQSQRALAEHICFAALGISSRLARPPRPGAFELARPPSSPRWSEQQRKEQGLNSPTQLPVSFAVLHAISLGRARCGRPHSGSKHVAGARVCPAAEPGRGAQGPGHQPRPGD